MRSGFFNSNIIGHDELGNPIYDRAEDAEFFAKYFSNFIGNGVYPNPSTGLQVMENSKMGVTVKEGCCFIKGYMGLVEEDGEELTIENSETSLSRIDRVVARLNMQERTIAIFVKKGNPSANPVAPDITRNQDIYELGLADILIRPNSKVITQANITDLRLNSQLCGIVAGTINQVDTTTIFNQYMAFLNQLIQKNAYKYDEWFNEFTTPAENQFNNWFNQLQDILDENTEANLLMEINRATRICVSSKEIENAIPDNSYYQIPIKYIVGKDTLSVYYMGEKLIKDVHYKEYGTAEDVSTCIKFCNWGQEIPKGRLLEFYVMGDYSKLEAIDNPENIY